MSRLRVTLVVSLVLSALVASGAEAHDGVRTAAGHAAEDAVTHTAAQERALDANTRGVTAPSVQRAAAGVAAAPQDVGQWGPVVNWPVVGVHVALLPNGKVLAFDSVGDNATETYPVHDHTRATMWDPSTGIHTPVNVDTGFNIFCSGLAHLPDGRMFMAGGNKDAQLNGIVQTHIFNPGTNPWSLGPDMAAGRWYPSVTPLSNGEMLITSGGVNTPEVRTLAGGLRALSTASLGLPLYPWMDVAPNGRAFYSGPDQTMRRLDTAGTGTWQALGPRDTINRDYGGHALFDVGKILVAGGGPSTRDARIVDLNGAAPQVSTTAPMAFGRRQHNLTVLADGTVLATGGNSSGASLVDLNAGVHAAEQWSPATGQWRTLAAMQITRQYHSTALLLPDGRVLSSGGGICGTCDQVGYLAKNAEIFSPPYLFDDDGTPAARPAITAAPTATSYGAAMEIETANPASISKVALVRLGAVTHSVDMEQRYIPLSITAGATSITATAPANANIAPPGPYMLFIINANGVPSVARMVTVTAAPPPVTVEVTPPSASVQVGQTRQFTATLQNATGGVEWSVDGGAGNGTITTNGLYTAPASVPAGQVTVRATHTPSGATDTATVTVTAATSAPQITTQPANQSVTAGGTATFTAAASGTPAPTVQWQVSTNGGTSYSNIAGATSTTLTLSSVTTAQNNNRYRAVFTNSAGTATTNAATLTVTAGAPPNDAFANAQALSGNTGTVTATNTGATKQTGEPNHAGNAGGGSIWYAWTPTAGGSVTIDTIGSSFDTLLGVYTGTAVNALTLRASNDDIASGNLASRVTFTVTAGTTYRIAVDGYNGLRGNVTLNWAGPSGTTTLPQITTQPANQSVTAGGTATFTAAASGTPAPTVQWQVSTNGGTSYSNIAGATSTTLTLSSVTTAQNNNRYRAVFTNSAGTATTNAATLTVTAATSAPQITTQPANQSVTAGGTATFTAAASGTPAPTVQWQVSTNGGTSYSNIAGATSTTLTLSSVTTAQNNNRYRAVFTNSAGTATTNAATLTVTAATSAPQITTQPANQSVTAGGTATFTAAASGTPAPTVQWQVSTNGGTSYSNIAGATSTTLTLSSVTTAQNNNRYRAVFTNSAGTATTNAATLTVTAGAPPNDAFANAQALSGNTGTVTATNTGATKQTGEPNHAGNAGGGSIWYAWTPTAGGSVTIDTIGSSFDTLLGVYTGTAVNALTLRASNDDIASGNLASRVTFTVTAGTTYRIAVNGYNGLRGNVTLNWLLTPAGAAPANDAFANAQVLTGATGTVTATNLNATKETGEPNHAGNAGGGSIWYAWTPTAGGSVTIDTIGSSFDTLLGVYTGTAVNALTLRASNDDIASGNTASRVAFTVTAGTTYRIAVDGYNGLRGNVTLNWQ